VSAKWRKKKEIQFKRPRIKEKEKKVTVGQGVFSPSYTVLSRTKGERKGVIKRGGQGFKPDHGVSRFEAETRKKENPRKRCSLLGYHKGRVEVSGSHSHQVN